MLTAQKMILHLHFDESDLTQRYHIRLRIEGAWFWLWYRVMTIHRRMRPFSVHQPPSPKRQIVRSRTHAPNMMLPTSAYSVPCIFHSLYTRGASYSWSFKPFTLRMFRVCLWDVLSLIPCPFFPFPQGIASVVSYQKLSHGIVESLMNRLRCIKYWT